MGRKLNSGLCLGVSGQISLENYELLNKLKEKIAVGDLVLNHQDVDFMNFIKNRKDKDVDGYLDVIGHGTPTNMEILWNNKIMKIDHRMLSRMLKHNKNYKMYKGVRLLSCRTGQEKFGFAQKLSNKLGVPVIAPNTYYFSYNNGVHFAADMNEYGKPNYKKMGKMIKFIPGGNIK